MGAHGDVGLISASSTIQKHATFGFNEQQKLVANRMFLFSMQVGVVGLGGLGHLAIQFLARAVGAEVYAISHSPNKKEEALKLGAHHFVRLDEIEPNSLDVILNTTPG